jgi:transposase
VTWEEAAISIAGITFVTVVASIVIWQLFGTWRARMAVSREAAYRALAEAATAAQQKSAEEQEKATRELAELRARVSEIEKLLRDVG